MKLANYELGQTMHATSSVARGADQPRAPPVKNRHPEARDMSASPVGPEHRSINGSLSERAH